MRARSRPAAVEATVVIAADGDAMFAEGGLIALAVPTEEVWSADLTVEAYHARQSSGFLSGFAGVPDGRGILLCGGSLLCQGSALRSFVRNLAFRGQCIDPCSGQPASCRRPGQSRPCGWATGITPWRMPLTWPLAVGYEYGFRDVNPGWAVGDTVPVALLAYTTPGEPTELVATAQGARAVELSWTAPEVDGGGVVGYRVESSVDGGVSWRELAADTGSADTSYRDASVGLGERRHYRVRGISRHRNAGPPSEPASATALHGILGIEVTSAPARGGDTYLAGRRWRSR